MKRYSEKFKERVTRRLLASNASTRTLSLELGVSEATLWRWRHAKLQAVSPTDSRAEQGTNKKELSALEKAELVMEAQKLTGEELGAFLRKHGLYASDLEVMRVWLKERLEGGTPPGTAPPDNKKERQADQKRIKALERELRKKDKALAEAAALLVLQKKVQALWEDEDDDIVPGNGGK